MGGDGVKVTWKRGHSFELERQPMPPERFAILCKLAGAAIGGAVLVAQVRMLGIWGLVWPIGTLALVGIYKLAKEEF